MKYDKYLFILRTHILSALLPKIYAIKRIGGKDRGDVE